MDEKQPEKSLFRKEALKKLYSSEDLEKALYVVKPINWIALVMILLFSLAVILWSFFGSITTIVPCQGIYLDLTKFQAIAVPTKGRLLSVEVLIGDKVKEGDVIARIWDEDTNKEIEIKAPKNGFISDIYVEKGSPVIIDQMLANLEEDERGVGDTEFFYCFVDAKKGEKINEGMKAVVYPWGIAEELGGGVKGEVLKISYLPASDYYFKTIHLNESFIKNLTKEQTLLPLTIKPTLTKDDEYIWTSKKGIEEIPLGTLVSADIYISSRRPISYLFPGLDKEKK
jgi:hypothetical protein